jgi:hypothetical protein
VSVGELKSARGFAHKGPRASGRRTDVRARERRLANGSHGAATQSVTACGGVRNLSHNRVGRARDASG